MDSNFNWNDLRYFLEVARAGSLSGAARILRTDHATVGRRVMALEQALSQTLFHRSSLGYMLTSKGESLLPLAEQMEGRALDALVRMGRPEQGLAGKVRLTTPEGFGNYFLSRHLAAFATAFPLLQLELVTIQQILSLSQREGDVVVTLSPPRKGQFQTRKLVDYFLRIYTSPTYLAKAEPIKKRGDLQKHPFIGYVDDLIFAKELDYLGEILPSLRAHLQSSSLFAQVAAVRNGLGLCVLPTYIAGDDPHLVEVLPGEITLRRSYWLSAHDEIANLPRVRAARDFVERIVALEARFVAPESQ